MVKYHSLYFSYCPAGSTEQFARKNIPRSKSLNYIARDKIKHVTPCTQACVRGHVSRMVAGKLR